MLRFRWDWISFLIGVAVGALLGYVLRWLQWLAGRWRARLQARREAREATRVEQVEGDYRRWLSRTLRGWHIVAPLFALDEVLLPPRVMPPPPLVLPEGEPSPAAGEEGETAAPEPLLPDDIVSLTVPHAPAWPELPTFYGATTLSLPEALQGGANLLLLGRPGSGKTSALLALALAWARREFPPEHHLAPYWPVYLHAGWIVPQAEGEDASLWEPLARALRPFMPGGLYRRWAEVFPTLLEQGRVLLLLDGLDELPPGRQRPLAEYMLRLQAAYPQLRIVAAAAPTFYDGWTRLGLVPTPLALWDRERVHRFLTRWGELWRAYVVPGQVASAPPEVDAVLLNRWLTVDRPVWTPLEVVLHAWAAYAGDALGPDLRHALEAYVRRMALEADRAGLNYLALQVLQAGPGVSRREVGRTLGLDDAAAPALEDEGAPAPDVEGDAAAPEADFLPPVEEPISGRAARRSLEPALARGLLVAWGEDQVAFAHPMVAAYLAGEAVARVQDERWLWPQDGLWWSLPEEALRFAAALGSGGVTVGRLVEADEEPLHRGLLAAARALLEGQAQAPWRPALLRRLTTLLTDQLLPLAQRGEVLSALLASREPGLAGLFRRWLEHRDAALRRLAALALGYLGDGKAVPALAQAIFDPDPRVGRAAVLALVALDTTEALEQVGRLLLDGSEEQRRWAAEALANHPYEGWETLREGATYQADLLVRRAVVFGLLRVPAPWARELLEKMQTEDSEWVVRNAAIEAVTWLQQPSPFTPRPPRPLHEEPFLIRFAAGQGVGVAPGEPAYELLGRCLREGDEDQRLAALARVVYEPHRDWTAFIYPLLYGTDEALQEGAVRALWALAAAGAEMPHPARYGLGRGMRSA